MLMLKDCIKSNSENAIGSYSILKCCTYHSCRLTTVTIEMELAFGYIVVDLLVSDVLWRSRIWSWSSRKWRIVNVTSKNVHINICPQSVLEVQPQRSPDLRPLDFCIWGPLQALTYSAPTEQEETFHQHIFMTVKPFTSTPSSLEVCESPRSDASTGDLIQVEDLLSNYCELWLDKQQEFNSY